MGIGLLRPIVLVFGLLLMISSALIAYEQELIDTAIIVSSNWRDNDQALYLITPDGTPFRRLTRFPGFEGLRSVSPDGRWMLVYSYEDNRVYSVNVGSGRAYTIQDDNFVSVYGWVNNGEWLLAAQRVVTGNSDVRTFYRQMPNGSRSELFSTTPDVRSFKWSPNGEWLYFSMQAAEGNQQPMHLYRVPLDGGQTELVSDAAEHISPLDWSRDGEWLIVIIRDADEDIRIARIRPNGDDFEVLTERWQDFWSFGWSPDREWYYYSARRNNQTEIYRLNGDTGVEEQLTDLEDKDFIIGWSADGEWLYCRNEHHRTQTELIYRMRPDGSQKQLLHTIPYIPYTMEYFESGGDEPDIAFVTTKNNARYHYLTVADDLTRQAVLENGLDVLGISNDGELVMLDPTSDQYLQTIFRVKVDIGRLELVTRARLRPVNRRSGPTTSPVSMSPDGEWIYYEVLDLRNNFTLMRIRPDGSGRQEVHTTVGINDRRAVLVDWIDYDIDYERPWRLAVSGILLGVVSLVAEPFGRRFGSRFGWRFGWRFGG